MDYYNPQERNYHQYRDYRSEPMTIGDWIMTMLVMAIPFVGFTMLFVWAFSDETNFNKKNWAKAQLIWGGVSIVIVIIVVAIAAGISSISFR
ncbi:MAG: hypothetical protein WC327_01820 [Candidatus Cloacimonadia bacterium]|jgi:heme/copper-type cytochrome/quinol oxidase subunit 2